MSVSAALKSALAVLPEQSRVVKFRGHLVVMHPLDAAQFAAIALKDELMCVSCFGIDLKTGQVAPPEQIHDARGKMSVESAATIIAQSMRDPEIAPLVANMTPAERRRGIDAAMELSIGGDAEGFFGDAAAVAVAVIKLASTLPREPQNTSAPADTFSTATRSSSGSKRSGRSKRN